MSANEENNEESTVEISEDPYDDDTEELSFGRQTMLELIATWMPSSLNAPNVPDGETQDLLGKAGWSKATGAANKKLKDQGKVFGTSCGDVLRAMLKLWHSDFDAAFMARDFDAHHGPGAKALGYYVECDGGSLPKPGDILVLRNGVGAKSAGSIGHVGILVEIGEEEWHTADGGGGMLPDQTAAVSLRTVRYDDDGIPILKSVTDGREKQLDGWIDLDLLTQTE